MGRRNAGFRPAVSAGARSRTGTSCTPVPGHDAGFTLVELMIVLTIVCILGALAYPSYAGYTVRVRRVEGQVALIDAMQRQERYRLQHQTYVEFSASEPGADGFAWWSGSSASASAYELDAHACPGREIGDCVEIRARPGTARVDMRFRDPDCGALTLDSTGHQGAEHPEARCWP
ncbi:type IV pilin protein [Massilia cellulosiltytica]|uniref:type IV pilin protein n=1 Tax=Massilia cellulosiltytica TaxID=2683234 RepID=UPI0039B6061B